MKVSVAAFRKAKLRVQTHGANYGTGGADGVVDFGAPTQAPTTQLVPFGFTITNIAVLKSGNTDIITNTIGKTLVTKSPQTFSHDLDGNPTNDGNWIYTWDPENRLTRMVANTLTGPQQRIDFAYDWQGRRVSKRVWNNTAGTGTLAADLKFVYDGWNLIGELNATNNAVIRSYIWGLDLSGSLQGAGGVGGLLAVNDAVNGMHFPAFDGNGNVAALVAAQSTTVSALYEHGPFGEILRATGPMALANPFRFSTKFQDDETGLLYYGYRYYDPSTGRWLSRDPIGEKGGINQFSFVKNQPILRVDIHGLNSRHSLSPSWQEHPTCIRCRCLSVEVRYEPSIDGPISLEWYIDPNTRRPKFGASIYVTWKVEGDPKGCRYSQDERNASLETTFPDGHTSRVPPVDNPSDQSNIDDMGVFAQGEGPYFVNLKWDVTFRCFSSDPTVPPVERHDGLWWFMITTHYPPPFPPASHE